MRIKHLRWTPWVGILTLAVLGGCGGGDEGSKADNQGENAESRSWAGGIGQKKGQPENDRPPVVVVETSLGDVTVELDPKKAELTVRNFLQYVDDGQYDGTVFHEVNQGSAILGGAYGPDLVEKETRVSVRNEAHNGLKNRRGTIAMARRPKVIDSATRLFFFNLSDNPDLDHKDDSPEGYGYCVFGRVLDGMDVLDKIGGVPVHQVDAPDGATFGRMPVQPVLIKKIRRK